MCCGPGLPLGQDRERRADRAIAAAVDDRSPLLVDATLPLVSCSHASSSRSSGRQLARCGEATPDAQQYRLRISKCCGTVRAAPPHLFPQCSCLGRRRRRRRHAHPPAAAAAATAASSSSLAASAALRIRRRERGGGSARAGMQRTADAYMYAWTPLRWTLDGPDVRAATTSWSSSGSAESLSPSSRRVALDETPKNDFS